MRLDVAFPEILMRRYALKDRPGLRFLRFGYPLRWLAMWDAARAGAGRAGAGRAGAQHVLEVPTPPAHHVLGWFGTNRDAE